MTPAPLVVQIIAAAFVLSVVAIIVALIVAA